MMSLSVVLVVVFFNSATCDSTLKLVNLVYRHGDRTPAVIFPTDPNQADKWPEGPGWLTKLGMQQQYALGGWLRSRYVDTGFLSSEYTSTELKVYSSDVQRCLMSAYANLAGMFPPGPGRQFNASLNWQPIPVHTRPVPEDNELAFGEPCPRYSVLANESYYLPETQIEEHENKEFYQWLQNKTGVSHLDINNIWMIADVVLIEKIHNLTLAPWVNDTVYEKLMSLINYQFAHFFETTDLQRLTGGPLLGEFIDNMKNKIKVNSPIPEKMYMYSAHDGTVAALLSALQVYNGIRPPYTAMVIAELHQNTGGHYFVRLFYKNTTADTLEDLVMPNCTKDCPLDRFIQLMKAVVPVDWLTECKVSPSSGSGTRTPTANLTCLACSDVTHLRYCDQTKTCQPDEICYVSKSNNIDGRLRYQSGCIPRQICNSAITMNSLKHCLQCCSTDYCNHAGCGDLGFQDASFRGPVCLDCHSIGHVGECESIKLCASNQACKIEEHKWGDNERLYKLGCEDKLTCSQEKSRARRSDPLCSTCCSDDFCNRNCTTTASNLPSEIIG